VISEAFDYDTFLKDRSTFFAFLFQPAEPLGSTSGSLRLGAVISEAHDYTTFRRPRKT
jgi:hypothetical protein